MNFLTDHSWWEGVWGNLMASAILAVLAYHGIWKRHIRPHLDRTKEIHAHLMAQKPPDPRHNAPRPPEKGTT